MPIKTGRGAEPAQITVNYEACRVCGLCAKVCKGGPLYCENDELKIDYDRFLGCIACGHCMVICPANAITVSGGGFSPPDVAPLPPPEARAEYEQLYHLMLARRSMREFTDRPVERVVVDKIITAASTAPMSIPPTDVEVLVLHGRAKVREFAGDIMDAAQRMGPFFSPLACLLMRPFIGREAARMMRDFVGPLIKVMVEERRQGRDALLWDAPLTIYFHTTPGNDRDDPLIACTYAMLAAESLGLGTCLIGTVGPVLHHSPKLMKKYGIPPRHKPGLAMIAGYPAIKFQRALRRTFSRVNFY